MPGGGLVRHLDVCVKGYVIVSLFEGSDWLVEGRLY